VLGHELHMNKLWVSPILRF